MEIIFVSRDNEAAEFQDYYMSMASWGAVPFANKKARNDLMQAFQVKGLPTLVLVDGKTGQTIDIDGRDFIEEYKPDAGTFPWDP